MKRMEVGDILKSIGVLRQELVLENGALGTEIQKELETKTPGEGWAIKEIGNDVDFERIQTEPRHNEATLRALFAQQAFIEETIGFLDSMKNQLETVANNTEQNIRQKAYNNYRQILRGVVPQE